MEKKLKRLEEGLKAKIDLDLLTATLKKKPLIENLQAMMVYMDSGF